MLSKLESDNRIAFYEQIIGETRKRLTHTQKGLHVPETGTGYTRLKGQEESTSLTASDLQSALLSREAQLSRMLATATEAHPAVRKMRIEITELRAQQQTLEGSTEAQKSGILLPIGAFPSMQSRVEPARREVDIQSEVLEYPIKAQQLFGKTPWLRVIGTSWRCR